jgi:hypothetical protein
MEKGVYVKGYDEGGIITSENDIFFSDPSKYFP